MMSGSSTIDLGGPTLTILDGGSFRLDGAALYGVFPRVFWEKLNRPDEDNRVLLGLAPVLVTTGDGIVIIDPGIGTDWSTRAIDRYDIRGVRPPEEMLADAGIAPSDVAAVIATHLHFDHVAGAVRRSPDSGAGSGLSDGPERDPDELEPAFPEAKLYVQRRELEASRQPDLRTASFAASHVARVYEREGRCVALEGDSQPFPGIRINPTGGHTPGHQAIWLEGSEATFLLTGDLVPTASHVRSEVLEGVDHEPAVTSQVKASLLSEAVSAGAFLTFYHAPRVRWGRVRSGPTGAYQLEETLTVERDSSSDEQE
jgi:glyoxylase-like metal-dependent hydrolase (beta-lactamase superfamily II)